MPEALQLGETYVCGLHGLVTVAGTEVSGVFGTPQEVYVLRAVDGRATIRIPVAGLSESGIREPMTVAQANEAIRSMLTNESRQHRRRRGLPVESDMDTIVSMSKPLPTRPHSSHHHRRFNEAVDRLSREVSFVTGDDLALVQKTVRTAGRPKSTVG